MNKISLDEKFALFSEYWQPKTIAALNGQFQNHVVALDVGDCVVVPHGVEHRTCADQEAWILCFEPARTINTGNVKDSAYTADRKVI